MDPVPRTLKTCVQCDGAPPHASGVILQKLQFGILHFHAHQARENLERANLAPAREWQVRCRWNS